MNYLHYFLFGIYPYIAIAIFLLGSLIRFEREQYSWKSESSEILHRGTLRMGSNLFHIGILGLFLGHLFGLLTPLFVWEALGITHSTKQIFAMVAGGIMGALCLAGIILLIFRRFYSKRLAINSTWRDKLVLLWLLATVVMGLSTIWVSTKHLDGEQMVALMNWAQHLVTFRSDAASYIINVPFVFKLHLFLGISVFVLFPFTRLVHAWSGVATVTYLFRPWQLVRPRK